MDYNVCSAHFWFGILSCNEPATIPRIKSSPASGAMPALAADQPTAIVRLNDGAFKHPYGSRIYESGRDTVDCMIRCHTRFIALDSDVGAGRIKPATGWHAPPVATSLRPAPPKRCTASGAQTGAPWGGGLLSRASKLTTRSCARQAAVYKPVI